MYMGRSRMARQNGRGIRLSGRVVLPYGLLLTNASGLP